MLSFNIFLQDNKILWRQCQYPAWPGQGTFLAISDIWTWAMFDELIILDAAAQINYCPPCQTGCCWTLATHLALGLIAGWSLFPPSPVSVSYFHRIWADLGAGAGPGRVTGTELLAFTSLSPSQWLIACKYSLCCLDVRLSPGVLHSGVASLVTSPHRSLFAAHSNYPTLLTSGRRWPACYSLWPLTGLCWPHSDLRLVSRLWRMTLCTSLSASLLWHACDGGRGLNTTEHCLVWPGQDWHRPLTSPSHHTPHTMGTQHSLDPCHGPPHS